MRIGTFLICTQNMSTNKKCANAEEIVTKYYIAMETI